VKFNDPRDWFGPGQGLGGGRQLQPQTWEGWVVAGLVVPLIVIVVYVLSQGGGSPGFHP
jgi:hypothetical protein